MTQLLTHRHLTRVRSAVARRIGAHLERPGWVIVRCVICPRFAATKLLSDRGWCLECERQFAHVMACLRRMGIVAGYTKTEVKSLRAERDIGWVT